MSTVVDNLVYRVEILVFLVLTVWGVCLVAVHASGDERPAEATEGFVALFDGRSLDGWKFEPQFAGHWVARDGVISCDGKVKVKRGGERDLWTEIDL